MNRKPNADNIVQWNEIFYMETLQIIVIAINRNFY